MVNLGEKVALSVKKSTTPTTYAKTHNTAGNCAILLRAEFEVSPHTKVRIVDTVDKKLCKEMELIHELEVKRAKDEDRSEPDWSNTIEMLLRKGVRAYKKDFLGPSSH